MPKSLVIVESPTKARTLSQFLSKDFIVESSIGHIRDLPESAKEIPASVKKEPWARLGIDIEHEFKPLYVIPSDKKQQVEKLKGLLKGVGLLYLATDEDREGESISWHLKEVLKPKVPIRRLVFHEITKDAILGALDATRDIDQRLVNAQETRRVLDRLYGYEISPILWRKIAPALSAGRVQSVAVRIIVNRERERMAFNATRFWDLLGTFAGAPPGEFSAELVSVAGKRLVSGRDFDPHTGRLQEDKAHLAHLDEAAALALRERLAGAAWSVIKVERKPYTSQPPPPFTTSTLQQEANRKLHWSSRETMRVAQGLYERGYITYMRTDSTTLSDQALRAARAQIESLYGADYLPPEPRLYRSTVKNAQEAHEAIRPAGESFRLPEALRGELDAREQRLYDLVWKRTVASQMPNAQGQRLLLQVQGGDAVFQATGKTIEFPGYLRAYVEGSDDPEAELGDQERLLPPLREGDAVMCRGLQPQEHVTQPPARFSEASLIKELEREGIGRPSTYASIIDTIVRREYAIKRGSALVPTFTAFAVVQLMEQYFSQLVDVGFTARMEDALDGISRGEGASLPYLKEFYFGAERLPGLQDLLKAEIDPRQACTIALGNDSQGRAMTVRVGRFGPYLERGEDRASIPASLAPDEVTLPTAEALLDKGNAPEVLGTDPATDKPVYVKNGRFGPYVQLGDASEEKNAPRPKMKSLLPGQSPEQLTLQDALQLLSLPRTVGEDPETGEPILADLGRYGPYLKRGTDSRSLPSAASLFTITVPEAQAIFRQAKTYRRGQATVLRQVGVDPQSQAPINLLQGRYGPYVTDGETNASLPRGEDPAALTLEQALGLLAARRAAGPPVRRAGRRTVKRGAPAGAAAGAAQPAPVRKTARAKAPAKAPAKAKPGKSTARAAARPRRQRAAS